MFTTEWGIIDYWTDEEYYWVHAAQGNGMESAPKDVWYVPTACVIGPPSAGKYDICEKLAQTTGAVHLWINEIIELLIGMDSKLGQDVWE